MKKSIDPNIQRISLKDLNESKFNDLQKLYREYFFKKGTLEDALNMKDDEYFYIDLVGDTTWGVVKTNVISELKRGLDELEKRISNIFIEDLN